MLHDLLIQVSVCTYFFSIGITGWLIAGPAGIFIAHLMKLVQMQIKIKRSKYTQTLLFYILALFFSIPLAFGFDHNDYGIASIVNTVTWIMCALCAHGAPRSDYPISDNTIKVFIYIAKCLLLIWLMSVEILMRFIPFLLLDVIRVFLLMLMVSILLIPVNTILAFRNHAFDIYDQAAHNTF